MGALRFPNMSHKIQFNTISNSLTTLATLNWDEMKVGVACKKNLYSTKITLFTLDNLISIRIAYWASSSSLSSFVHQVVGDVKLDAQ